MYKRLTIFYFSLFLFFTSCFSPNFNLEVSSDLEPHLAMVKIDKWLKDLSLKRKFNGAILIALDGKPDLIETYGFSDVARTKPLTKQSSFRLASVSKQFTAMGIMILKEQGKLNYDNYVRDYLNAFPYPDITIRHLLTHTSGLPDYEKLVLRLKNKASTKYFFRTGQSRENIIYKGDPSEFKNLHDILAMQDILNLVIEYSDERKFSAGEKFNYSNTGYVLLAYIIERVTGQTFENFLDQEIFNPLRMKNSSVWNLNTISGKMNDRVYGTNKAKLNDFTWMDGIAGDGAVFVSIEDFLKWDIALTNNSLVSDSTFQDAVTPFITTNGDTSFYGFGWALSDDDYSIDHAGGWVGALTYIYRNPENGVLFVLLDSSTNKDFKKIRESILEILYEIY
ncbi:MAG: hypothetical protein CMG55_10365 [Candidatus Marinimicrobia bacterium]|nr:hypothetical protein [Candidatus Neomarinimicrobiota bacterium]|tara:strand:- start:2925 stop:4106 length:1182 start_codon:yes stop_codon:yes gene_type:complete